MRWLRRLLGGLRAQLLLPVLAALVVAQAVSVALFFNERRQAIRAALATEIAGRVANTVQLLEDAAPETYPSILRSARSPFFDLSLTPEPANVGQSGPASDRILDALRADLEDETRTMHVVVAPLADPVRAAPMHQRHVPWADELHRRHHPRAAGAMQIALSTELTNGTWLNARTMFRRPPLQAVWPSTIAVTLAAIAIVFVIFWSVQRISRPMRALAESADRLGRGDDPLPLALEGPAEVRRVADAFNMMQDRLTRHVRERTRMLAALGHDLRSPLTAIRLRAEMVDDEETRERLVASIDEMQTMVETTLSYAKSIAADETATPTDLRRIAVEIADELRLNGSRVDVEPGESLTAVVRPIALKRALRNLMENAVRYGIRAIVRLEKSDRVARIIVDDDGLGVPEADLANVFEPFVRLDASRSRETGGVGLGLSVCRTIARAHGGDVSLQNRPEGGLRAELSLPL